MHPTTRRVFLAHAASALLGLAASPVAALGGKRGSGTTRPERPDHPDPRPGIDARNVTPREHLPRDVVAVFDRVREIPQVVDGIACQCGCAELEDMRSLLSCFEGHGMAMHCVFCQGQADLAHRMHRAGPPWMRSARPWSSGSADPWNSTTSAPCDASKPPS